MRVKSPYFQSLCSSSHLVKSQMPENFLSFSNMIMKLAFSFLFQKVTSPQHSIRAAILLRIVKHLSFFYLTCKLINSPVSFMDSRRRNKTTGSEMKD